MVKGRIHSFESFGAVDGPGTRFVIFFQGCNLRCLYCHNPDSWERNIGKEYSVEEIYDKYDKIKEFVTGGITISGGEPLLQYDFLLELVKKFHANNVHVAIDTSGSPINLNKEIGKDKISTLMQYVDLVLLDIKHIDSKEHKKLTTLDNNSVLNFARYLSDINQDVWIRHVIVPTINMENKYYFALGKFLSTLNNIKGIEVLPYHTMALPKYEILKLEYPLKGIPATSKQEALKARNIIIYAMNFESKKK